METMIISEFKAKAIATLKRVRKTRNPILITLRGEPIAEIVPCQADGPGGVRIGAGKGRLGKYPAADEWEKHDFDGEWEMNA
jgi:prevent-host-death family protein